jgi:hypothetical protein
VLFQNREFLTLKELIAFVSLFIVFLIAAFPENILPQILKNDYSETSLKYLERLIEVYKNNNLVYLLIDKYVYIGEYTKASKLLANQKKTYKRYFYEYVIVKNLFFQKKFSLKDVKYKLQQLYKYADDNKKKEFIYKEAISFSFYDLAFLSIKDLDKLKEYIELAIYLKKYNLAIKKLLSELNKKFDEYYFNKLIEIALYTKKTKIASYAALEYYSFVRSKKGYENLLRVGIVSKNSFLVKYSIDKTDNEELKLQGYLVIKDYQHALKIAKKMKNYNLIAQIYLLQRDYQNALRYFIKDGFEKNIKVITSLAYLLKKYSLLEKILLSKIEKGDYSKLSDLTYIYQSSVQYEKGIKVYKRLYKKTKNDLFLKELFKLYYDIGDDESIKELVKKFKKLPLNIALYASDLYISERNYKLAYKIMKKAVSNKYEYYERLWFLANKLGYKNEELKILYKMQKIKVTAKNTLALYLLYLEKDKVLAFNYLKDKYTYSETLFYELLKTAYELKKYKYIINLKPSMKPSFYYSFLIKSYLALKKYHKVKKIYQEAIKKYPEFENDYYWFLISTKDKSIKKYLSKIKDKKILLGAYIVLGNKFNALKIIKELAQKENNIDLWLDYYYLSDDEKVRFLVFKKIDLLISHNKNLLFNEKVLEFYFYNSLFYKSAPSIEKLLFFIKKHNLNYKKYLLMYLEHFREIERLKGIIQ